MKLEKIKYSQYEGQAREWKLEELELEDTNLLVGKNASGKTKTLNLINNLARLLCGKQQPLFASGTFDAMFDLDGSKLRYIVGFRDSSVFKEEFERDGTRLLERGNGGVGKIWAEKQKDFIEFQTPVSQLVAITRRDSIQHSFFENLHDWGKSVYYFPFGSPLGKDRFAIFLKDSSIPAAKKTDFEAEAVVGVFKKAEKEIGEAFIDSIKRSMGEIGYPIVSIGLGNPISVNIAVEGAEGYQKDVRCLYVQEQGLNSITDQNEMSQGMFRALSIIIHITFAEMVSRPSCIVIDDIGEGLDFERSTKLIEMLVQRAHNSKIQLIMATNDRFIMNKVPLKAWAVLQRSGSHLRVYNYKNSKQVFDKFALTGLNNFDFFSLGFINQERVNA